MGSVARRVAIGIGCMAVSVQAMAQENPHLTPGVPVRLTVNTVAGFRSISGSLLLLDLDSVSVVPPGALYPTSVPLSALERFTVNRGKPRALLYGAPIYGAALGTLFAATALRPDVRCRVLPDADGCHWETSRVVVGAVGGAILLGMIVRLVVPDVWQEIPLHALGVKRTDVGPPSLQLGLRARF